MIAPVQPAAPRRLFTLRFLALLAAIAGIVHIVSAFASMNDRSRDAYARLAPDLKANTMTLMPPVRPGAQYLPFLSTDARYALCRFDTTNGPVSVTAQLPDLGWTIGIYRRDGSAAYFAAASEGRTTNISLTLMPGDDRFTGLTPEALGKADASASPLTVSARQGLVVVRAPDKGLAYAAQAETGLTQADCAPRSY